MNSKERVEAALNFENPDRTPIFATYVPEIETILRDQFGSNELDLGVVLGNDMVKDCVGLECSFYGQPEPEYTDEWGISWRYMKNDFGVFTEIVDSPLALDKSKLDNFKIPDPNKQQRYDSFRKLKELYSSNKWMIGSCQISIFEASWYLRGMDNLLMDMISDPDFVHALMDNVMQFPLNASQNFINLGADMVWFGDDVAMQNSMMISVDMWRTFLKPRYAAIFQTCKELNPNIKIAYHSCGNCEMILDDMIEIGLDVLNPLQPLAIDPCKIKKKYGKRLALFGGFCVQQIMPFATPEKIKLEVNRLINECGKNGGYILAPAHHIQADTPIENICAFYNAGMRNK